MAIIQASQCQVFIGDVEITRHVRSLSMRAEVGEVVTTTLSLFGVPFLDKDGDNTVFRLLLDQGAGTIHPPIADGRPVRALLIRDCELTGETEDQ